MIKGTKDLEGKYSTWRILTPILSIVSPTIVGILGWFILNSYNDQKEINKSLLRKLENTIVAQSALQLDFEKRITTIQYSCCKQSKDGRFQ